MVAHHGVAEGSLLFLLGGLLAQPDKEPCGASVQDEGIL